MRSRDFVRWMVVGATVAALLLIGAGSAPPARAAYIVTLTQQGSDVVATGSGTLDLAGLSVAESILAQGLVSPNVGELFVGPATAQSVDLYTSIDAPSSFGGGSQTFADSGSGLMVGVGGTSVAVPVGYISGDPLFSTATWDNQTFTSLGVTPGIYVWTWGGGDNGDSFTLDIATPAMPEPASLLLAAPPLGFVALLAVRRRRRTGFSTIV